MSEVIYTPRAEQDMRDIWRYIAHDSVSAADALLLRFFAKPEFAASHPIMGQARPELSDTARTIIEGQYILIYEPDSNGILLVAIVHGARHADTWM